MSSLKRSIKSIIVLVVSLGYCGCSLCVPEIKAEMTDLVLCKGWDEGGAPIALSEPVSPDETRLCVCSHLQTNEDVLLQISWGKDRTSLLEYREVFDSGPFLSCVEDAEGFDSGNYGVSVMMSKRVLGFLEFSVDE